jgi:DNA-binding XRE family transcriptional regulator
MTAFKSSLSICGLSQSEAAEFLEVSIDTVKSWCSGRANPPLGVWQLLASLFEQVQDAADGAADIMDLEGIDPRAFNNVEADIPGNELPASGAIAAAGAMALLMTIAAQLDGK